jgi:GNAT superfamily N-acetyltransferase
MKFRLLEKNEVNSVLKIVGKNYSEKWALASKPEIFAMFNHKTLNPRYFVVEDNNIIIGFGGYCTSWMDYNLREIFWINVLPEFQKKGVGRFLVNGIIEQIRRDKTSLDYKAKLVILTCKDYLVPFYKSFGFRKILSFSKNRFLMGMKL